MALNEIVKSLLTYFQLSSNNELGWVRTSSAVTR